MTKKFIKIAASFLAAVAIFCAAACDSSNGANVSDTDIKNLHTLPAKDDVIYLEGMEVPVHYEGAVVEASGEGISSFGIYYDTEVYKVFENSDKLVIAPNVYNDEDMESPWMCMTIVQSAQSVDAAIEAEKARLTEEGALRVTESDDVNGNLIIHGSWEKKEFDGSRMEAVMVRDNKKGGSIAIRIRYIADTGAIEGGYSRMRSMSDTLVIFED